MSRHVAVGGLNQHCSHFLKLGVNHPLAPTQNVFLNVSGELR
jgi:hypothetical protein